MQVILKENIETLGHIGDIVKVAPGYARNYLLPKGLAVEATEKMLKPWTTSNARWPTARTRPSRPPGTWLPS